MAAASLVVRISADLNSFSRDLNKMTRDVDKASKKIGEIGKSMTIGLTLPIGLAIAAMVRLGTQNDAVASKFARSFGPATDRANQMIEKMGKIVPETTTELRLMAIQSQDFARGLGMSAPKAELLSEQMLKLAANISAAKFIPMSEAIDTVMRGLEGQTRGLKSVGIAVDQAEVKQEAYRLGLLKVGESLTPLGTALAMYSLLTKKTGNLQDEASKQQQNAARQMQFLKRDVIELAESTGAMLVPAIRVFVSVAREIVQVLSAMPSWLRVAIVSFGAMLAVLGPTILIIAKLTQAITTLRAALVLLAEGSAVRKFLEMLVDPEMILVMGALAVAIGGAVMLWKKFHKEVEDTKPVMEPLLDVKSLMGGSAKTSENMKDPLQQLQERAQELTQAFDQHVESHENAIPLVEKIRDLQAEVLKIYGAQSDKLDKMALGARQIYIDLMKITTLQDLSRVQGGAAAAGTTRGVQQAVSAASQALATPDTLRLAALNEMISQETEMRKKEIALNMPDIFNATRVAAIELRESFRTTSHDFQKTLASFKSQWTSNLGGSVTAGLQGGFQAVLASMGPVALIFEAVGKVLQGFQPVIDKLMGPLVALGQILADIVEPVLRPLFQALKLLGIATALTGEVIYTVASGIARLIGNLIVAIGKFIAKIPFLGGVGRSIQDAGNGMLNLAKSMSNTAKQLDKDRTQLQDMNFDDAANGLTDLGSAAKQTSKELLNVADGFKLTLREFQATIPLGSGGSANTPGGGTQPTSSPGGTNGSSGGGSTTDGGDTTGNSGGSPLQSNSSRTRPLIIQMNSRTVAKVVLDVLRSESQAQFGTTTRITEVNL